jgi:adenylate kinase
VRDDTVRDEAVRLVLLGPPGAGKGTQAERLCRERNLLHLSTGDLLRKAVREGTETGKKAKAYMDRGELVPDALVLTLVRERLAAAGGASGFLLDGYPRNVAQAKALEDDLRAAGTGIDAVVHLRLEDAEIVRRLLQRGRPDDTEPVVRNRLAVYRAETAPLIDWYRKAGTLRTVDALGTVDEVTQRIRDSLEVAA